MRIRLLALLILLSSFSFGQTLVYTRVVKGNLWLPPGTPAPNSKMRFQLKYCGGQVGRVPVNPGNPPGPTGLIVSFEPFDVNVSSDGSWQTQIYGNDQILCGTDTSGPSRWLVQPVFNGAANAGVEYKIQSCGAASPCQPFVLDTAPQCSATVVTDCAVETGNPDQPDTTVTVNAVMAVPNAYNFGNVLLPPANGTVINFMQNGNQAGAYLPGNGIASNCLSGTGTWVACGGGTGGAITGATANRGLMQTGTTLGLITCSTNQYLSWSGSAWVCTTLTGGGGGGSLPTIAQYNLYASNGSGGAQDSGIKAGLPGFLMTEVTLATGDVSSAPAPFQLFPNASVEYFPSGYGWTGGTAGAAHGLAMYMSHSSASSSAGNGGIALGGGNSGGTGNQVYLDCETTGCDFKVPVTENGSSIGGGGGGSPLPTTAQYDLFSSTGSGTAAASGVLGTQGFLRANVLEATGTGNASPFTLPNGSIEYFPTGGYGIGNGTGLALHFSHSGISNGVSPGWGNGGIALAGGNSTGANYQIYLDCESQPSLGCDFKVPVSLNGTALGGGGSPGVSSINGTTGAFIFSGPGVTCGSPATTCTFTGGGGGGSGTVGAGTGSYFAWYPATGTTIGSNPALNDNGTIITSTETIAAPGFDVIGSGGFVVTGPGGNLPTPQSGQGGIGIGPGNVPQYYSNGGAWTAIGSGGGGGTITGPTASGGLLQTGTTLGLLTSCASGQVLQWNGSAWACATGGGTTTIPNPILTTAGATLSTPPAGQGSIGIGPGGVPSVSVAGGGWLPIATSYASSAVPIAHGAQAMVCQASNTQSTGAGITISSLTIGSNETAIVAVAPFYNVGNSFTVHDNNNVSYTVHSSTTLFIFTSAIGASQPASSITVAQTTGSVKFVACVASYTGVTAIGATGSNNATSGTQSVSINAAAAGNYLFSLFAITGPATSTFTQVTGTLLPAGTSGTSTTAASSVSAVVCENVAAAAGSVTCSTTSSLTTQGWNTLGIELVGGGGSTFSPQCPVTSDISFGTTAGTVCSRTFPSQAKAWIVKCVIPWNFNASQSGNASVTVNLNQSVYAGPGTGTYWNTILWSNPSPLHGNIQQTATGATQLISTTALSLSDGFIYTLTLDGVANIPSTGGTFSLTFSTSTGTASVRTGAFCSFQ